MVRKSLNKNWLSKYQQAGPVVKIQTPMPADVLFDGKKFLQWMKDHPEVTAQNAMNSVPPPPRPIVRPVVSMPGSEDNVGTALRRQANLQNEIIAKQTKDEDVLMDKFGVSREDARAMIQRGKQNTSPGTIDFPASDPRSQSYKGNSATSLLWNPNQVEGQGARALEAGFSVPIDLAAATSLGYATVPSILSAMDAPIVAGAPAYLTANNLLTAAMIPSGARALSFLPADVQSGNLSGFAKHGFEAGLDLLPLAASSAPFIRSGINYAGRALGTEEGLLSNAYKINPWAFKADPEAYYRMLGKEGYADALESGVIRSNQKGDWKDVDAYFNKGNILDNAYEKKYRGTYDVFHGYDGPHMVEVKNEKLFKPIDYETWKNKPKITQSIEPISINDPSLQFYKRDWLRGYKPVNVESKVASGTDRTVEEMVSSARNGDAKAQQKLSQYGLGWDEKPTKYRQVGEEEIDKLFNGETVLPARNGSYLDVSDHPFYWGKENDNFKYHVTFKDEPHFDTQLTGGDARAIEKNKEQGEYGIRDGYSLNDVAKVEKMNERTGEWEIIYNGVDAPDNLDAQIEKLQNKVNSMREQEVNAEKANTELFKEYKARTITADEYRERYITPDIEGRGYLENQIRQLKVKKDIAGAPQKNILNSIDQLGENISTGGLNTKGVFDLGNGFVARRSAHGYDDASRLINYTDKLESPRIMKTHQVTELNGDIYQVQDKATGIPYTELTKEEISNIPKEQVTNFWKDIEELKRNGLNIDISGRKANIFYDRDKGFQFIDLGIGKMDDTKEISKIVGIPEIKLPKAIPRVAVPTILQNYKGLQQHKDGGWLNQYK